MAHAAERTIATIEKIHDGNLLDDPVLAAGTLPGFYVENIAVAERGAWPLGLPDHYSADAEHLAEYARMAATPEGFADYLDKYVYARRSSDPSCPALCRASTPFQKERRGWPGQARP